MSSVIRALQERDRAQAAALDALAFGLDPGEPLPPSMPGLRAWGVFEGERLLAKAAVRTYAQWWGGRPVPMGGLADVSVHPDARGRGLAGDLVRQLLGQLQASALPISALFPTAPGIYRSMGWELVAELQETELPTSALQQPAAAAAGAVVRSAGPADRGLLQAL